MASHCTDGNSNGILTLVFTCYLLNVQAVHPDEMSDRRAGEMIPAAFPSVTVDQPFTVVVLVRKYSRCSEKAVVFSYFYCETELRRLLSAPNVSIQLQTYCLFS